MSFNEIMTKIRDKASKTDVSGVAFLAVQVNVIGENCGVFYIEVRDGKVSVEPYEYNDRQCRLIISMDNFNKLISGKLDPVAAFTLGKLKVEGDVGKALEFGKLIKK
jgi:putative sterol carrier protein